MQTKVFLNARTSFEKRFNCNLCMHDYEQESDETLLPDFHLNCFCTGLKKNIKAVHTQCVFFDQMLLQQKLAAEKKTIFKRCPAGFIECVFPIFREGRLAGCLFAGPFSAGDKMPEIALTANWKLPGSLPDLPPPLPPIPEDLEDFLAWGELLAAAVETIHEQKKHRSGNVKELIRDFLRNNYQKNIGLVDIAELLSLTPPRASDRILREFGQRFCVLLKKYRLNAACRLLENSTFPVGEIASRSGFQSGGYFHRTFHKEFQLTPQEYRQKHQRKDV